MARPSTPREVAQIRARLVVRLRRQRRMPTPALPPLPSRRFGGPLLAATERLAPDCLARRHARGGAVWGYALEPVFPGAPSNEAHGLDRYWIISLPWTRGARTGWLWDLAYALAREVADIELIYPESFSDAYKPLSAGAAASAPGDLGWSLRQMRLPAARAFAQAQQRPDDGRGVTVGHLDTGWSRHPQLQPGLIDQARQRNLLSVAVFPPRVESANDAIDPYCGPLDLFHSHGLATAAVLGSRGALFAPDPASLAPGARLRSGTGLGSAQVWPPAVEPLDGSAEVVGVASGVSLIPVRCADSVVLSGDIEIAQAVWYACQQNVDVITMSLGGVPSPLLHAALGHAVNARNIVFCAAAGNLTPFVVFPAAYPEAIACAGAQPDGNPWRALYGSSFGPQVDISAPAQGVWVAHMRGAANGETPVVEPGEGTSFATPAVAGAAALWLAFHGRQALLARYPGIPLQDVFRTVLMATASNPSSQGPWPADFGAGVVDLDALLRFPLPAPAAVIRPSPWSADAFLGYLGDGVAALVAAAAAGAAPRGALGAMALLELAQLLLTQSDFVQTVRDFGNQVQRDAAQVVDGIARAIDAAAEVVSAFFHDLFGG